MREKRKTIKSGMFSTANETILVYFKPLHEALLGGEMAAHRIPV